MSRPSAEQVTRLVRSMEHHGTRLAQVASGRIPHIYKGDCPDELDGYDQRDGHCPACNILIEAEEGAGFTT